MRQKTNNSSLAKDRCACILGVITVLFGVQALAQPLLAPDGSMPAEAPTAADSEVSVGTVGTKSKDASSPEASPHAADAATLKSLFFTQEEMAALHRAIAIYGKYAVRQHNTHEGEDFLKQLEGKVTLGSTVHPKKNYTYPQFFLESLAYHSPHDWIVQLNRQRITPQTTPTALGNIRVREIDKDKVSIEWKPDEADMDKINALTDTTPDEGIDIDRTNGIIIFTLYANQTFSSYALQVLEGKVQPVTVANVAPGDGNKITRPVPVVEKAPPPAPSKDPAPAPAGPHESGLGGLIGAYKNLDQENTP